MPGSRRGCLALTYANGIYGRRTYCDRASRSDDNRVFCLVVSVSMSRVMNGRMDCAVSERVSCVVSDGMRKGQQRKESEIEQHPNKRATSKGMNGQHEVPTTKRTT